MSYGIEVWKNLSKNLIKRGTTNIYSLVKDAALNNCTISADTIPGPISGLASNPLKMTVTGPDPHIMCYNVPQWSIANAQQYETFTLSVWVKASQTTTVELFIFGADANGECFANPDYGAGQRTVGTNWTRVHYSYQMNKSTTRFVQARLDGTPTSGNNINIWWDCIQLESGVATPTDFNSRASEKVLVNDMLGGRVFLGLMNSASITTKVFTDVPTAADLQVYTLRYGYSAYTISQPTGGSPTITFISSGGNSSASTDFWRSTVIAVFAKKVNEPNYGISVVNSSGERLSSTVYPIPVFLGEIPIDGTARYNNSYTRRHTGQANLGTTNSNKLILWALPETGVDTYFSGTAYIPAYNSTLVEVELDVYTALTSYSLPRAYAFQLDNISSLTSEHSNYGLQLFNASGQKTFDSGLSHISVAGILTGVNFTTTNTETSKSLPSNLIGAPLVTFPQYARQQVVRSNTYNYRNGSNIYTVYEDTPDSFIHRGVLRYQDGYLYYRQKISSFDTAANFAIGEYYYSNSNDNYILVVDGSTYAANVGISLGGAFTATINKTSGNNTCSYDTRFASNCENQEYYTVAVSGSNGNPINYSWQILNPSTGGNFSLSLAGTVLTATGQTVVLYNRASAGIEDCTLKCTITQAGNPTLETSLNIVRTHNQETATATLTPARSSYNEGETIQVNIATTSVPNGTTLYAVSDAGTTVNWGPVDFEDTTYDFWVYIYNNSGQINRKLRNDLATEGQEKLKLKLVTAANGTNQVGTSSPEITIADTSVSAALIPISLTLTAGTGTTTCSITSPATTCMTNQIINSSFTGGNFNTINYTWEIVSASATGVFLFTNNMSTLYGPSDVAGSSAILRSTGGAGTYTCIVKCSITQAGTTGATATLSISRTHTTYVEPAPVPGFTLSATSGQAPLSVTVTDTSTNRVSQQWAVTDPNNSTTTYTLNVIPQISLTIAGTWKYKQTVYNSSGASASQELTVAVSAPPPTLIANFTLSATSGQSPLAVTATDTSTGSVSVILRTWKVYDPSGNITTYSSNPLILSLTATGTWTIELIVYGSNFSIVSTTRNIVVSAPPVVGPPQISSVVINPNPTAAGNDYTVTVTMNRAVTTNTSLDALLENVVLSNGTTGNLNLPGLFTVLAGNNTVTSNGKLGPDYGTRTGTFKISNSALGISTYSTTWNFTSLAPSIPAILISDNSATATTIVSGAHLVNNVYWYYFIVSAPGTPDGTLVPRTIETRGSGNDTVIGLYNHDGNLIASDDDGNTATHYQHSKITRNDFKVGSVYWVGVAKYLAVFNTKWQAASGQNSTPAPIISGISSIIVYV